MAEHHKWGQQQNHFLPYTHVNTQQFPDGSLTLFSFHPEFLPVMKEHRILLASSKSKSSFSVTQACWTSPSYRSTVSPVIRFSASQPKMWISHCWSSVHGHQAAYMKVCQQNRFTVFYRWLCWKEWWHRACWCRVWWHRACWSECVGIECDGIEVC